MSKASKACPRPRSGIPKPKASVNVVQKRRSAPPDGFINNLDAVFKQQQQTDDDKYMTKRIILHARRTGQLNLSGKGLANGKYFEVTDPEKENLLSPSLLNI